MLATDIFPYARQLYSTKSKIFQMFKLRIKSVDQTTNVIKSTIVIGSGQNFNRYYFHIKAFKGCCQLFSLKIVEDCRTFNSPTSCASVFGRLDTRIYVDCRKNMP